MDHKEMLKTLTRKKLSPTLRGSHGERLYWNMVDDGALLPTVEFAADSIQELDRIWKGKPSRTQRHDASRYAPLTTQDVFYSDELAKKITPWVKALRKQIFDNTEPPFDWASAVRWIEEEAQKRYHGAISQKVQDKTAALAAELRKHDIELVVRRRSLPYSKKGNEWQHRQYVNGPKMDLLERETRRMAKGTGFNQSACVLFILAGLPPVISRLKISRREEWAGLTNDEGLHRQELILTIRAKDFTFKELQRIYARMKKELSLIKKIPEASINKKRLDIFRLVQKHGEPPARGKAGHWKFWQQVFKEWKKRNPKRAPGKWQGLRDSWERSNERLRNVI